MVSEAYHMEILSFITLDICSSGIGLVDVRLEVHATAVQSAFDMCYQYLVMVFNVPILVSLSSISFCSIPLRVRALY